MSKKHVEIFVDVQKAFASLHCGRLPKITIIKATHAGAICTVEDRTA